MDNNGCDQSGPDSGRAEPGSERRGLPFTPPKGTALKHGRYYLIIRNRWHPLTRAAEGALPFWRAYYRLTRADPEFMAGVFLAFLEEGIPQKVADGELSAATAKKYEAYILTRLIPYCGHLHREDINSAHVARYLEERKKAGAPIAANREKAAWSSACEFALRKAWITVNPCHGVRRNLERRSGEYVEHTPLVTALDRAPPELYALMGVAYVLGIRQTDLRLARLDQVVVSPLDPRKTLLIVVESKTGKRNEHEITSTVSFLLEHAAAHRERVAQRYEQAAAELERLSQRRRAASRRARAEAVRAEPHIFLSARGLAWTESGLQSALRRFQAGFKFRALRAKAQTDRPDADVLGHTGQMRDRYHKVRRLSAVK